MGDANPIRTLRDYSKPSHEGYRNTIELLRRTTGTIIRSKGRAPITYGANRCFLPQPSSEDPNQHLKDFLKLVDSLDALYGSTPHGRNLLLVSLLQILSTGKDSQNSTDDILMFHQHQDESHLHAWT
ncbi:hypothetical protein Tco_0539454 [Tanacetum coccineum]